MSQMKLLRFSKSHGSALISIQYHTNCVAVIQYWLKGSSRHRGSGSKPQFGSVSLAGVTHNSFPSGPQISAVCFDLIAFVSYKRRTTTANPGFPSEGVKNVSLSALAGTPTYVVANAESAADRWHSPRIFSVRAAFASC